MDPVAALTAPRKKYSGARYDRKAYPIGDNTIILGNGAGDKVWLMSTRAI
jgi:hypothetical protein